ncbi:MAG: hypothetical protein OXU53_01900 [Deltaproteobacteria bacterium]|nr:hypothetical protein [Deltaproteobacteria bacterium]
MAYLAPKDYSKDPALLEAAARKMAGDLDLDWMQKIRERAAFRPGNPHRGLTLADINGGSYGPDSVPELVRHNFSMAPRGAILPKGLPSLGYTLNRKSEVWADAALALFEEGKSRHWAPARDIPWHALDGADPASREERALRQLCSLLSGVGLVCADIAARAVYRLNIEFHEIKYLLCMQMLDGARIAEATRKRALYGAGSLGVDSQALGELLKMVADSDSYPQSSAGLNLHLASLLQSFARHLEWATDNAADAMIWTRVAQDASRFLSYGVDHLRTLLRARPGEAEELNQHLDLLDNGLVGALGATEVIEPLIVLSGGAQPVARLYETLAAELFSRCESAGLGPRRARSPLCDFLKLLPGSS